MILFRFLNTLKFLKVSQIYWRFYYKIRSEYRKIIGFKYDISKDSKSHTIKLIDSICIKGSYRNREFYFLNRSKSFDNAINWNFSEFGKLWCYNLNYFEYLNYLSKHDGLDLINKYINDASTIKSGMDPFPISLRCVNWIKFLIKHNIKNKKIDDSLYAQYYILKDNFEFHLLGNHLLENACSLLFGSYYFNDVNFYLQSKKYLLRELKEQILEDGGHFELSPMYHQLILFRILECINIVKNNILFDKELLHFLETRAIKMLEWLESITYKNGNIPLFNDSAFCVAPNSNQLFDYASNLKLKWKKQQSNFIPLKYSGYYKYQNTQYELIADVGNIGPDYNPGHSHCDIFNFELYYQKKPIIVDTGTATYENNTARMNLRSVLSHNTVIVNNTEQSEIWGSFRVANRANVYNVFANAKLLSGEHDGYAKKFGIVHKREFKVDSNSISIKDNLTTNCKATAFLHFHPLCRVELKANCIVVDNFCKISFSSKEVCLQEYFYQPEFNKYIKAKKACIVFEKNLNTEIVFEDS